MHLLCDLQYETQFKKNLEIPIHVILTTSRDLPFENLSRIHSIYIQNIIYNGQHNLYTGWKQIKYTIIKKEVNLNSIFINIKKSKNITLIGAIVISIPITTGIYIDLSTTIIKIIFNNDIFDSQEIILKNSDLYNGKPHFENIEKVKPIQEVRNYFDLNIKSGEMTIQSSKSKFLHQGPLEPPSTIRGHEFIPVHKKMPIINTTKEKTTLKSSSWFEQEIILDHITDISNKFNFFIIWYPLSFYTKENLEFKTVIGEVKHKPSFMEYIEFEQDYLINIGNRIFTLFSNFLLKNKKILTQRFLCHFPVTYDHTSIFSFLHVAREIWILNLSMKSCIIKAIIAHLSKNQKRDIPKLNHNEYWGDLIDCSKGCVIFGEKVYWDYDCETQLYSTRRNNQIKPWEIFVDCFAIYTNEKLDISLVIPGGFCATTKITIIDQDVCIFKQRYELS